MRKQIASFIVGFLLVVILGYRTVQAQSFPDIIPIPVALSNTDYGSTYIPEGQEQSDIPTTRAIIGEDNRVPVELQGYFPWSAIGRIDWVINGEEVGQCTGTLIAKDVVLTNSHCLFHIDQTTGQVYSLNQIVFMPNLVQGEFSERDQATVVERVFGWHENFKGDVDDWALLRIDQPLGEVYGYLGWRQLDLSNLSVLEALQNQVRLAGYSGDYPPQRQ